MSEATDILQKVDVNTGETVNYRKVTKFYDGTSMTDAKCDGTIYRKKGTEYYVLVDYLSRGEVHVKWFGAKGDGATDDTAAIQKAFNAAYQISEFGSGEVYTGVTSRIVFSSKHYRTSATIACSLSYPMVYFNGAKFTPKNSNDFFAFDFTTIWQGEIHNVILDGYKKHIRMYNPNLDQGQILLDRIDMNGGNIGYDIDLRSSKCTIRNYKFSHVKQPGIIRQCDKIAFKSGWISAGKLDQKYQGMFELYLSSSFVLDDVKYVPISQDSSGVNNAHDKVFLVKNISGSEITLVNSSFGGEPGHIPLVGNFAEHTAGRGANITIRDCESFTTNSAVVELYNMPSTITIDNLKGGVEAVGDKRYVRYAPNSYVNEYNAASPSVLAKTFPDMLSTIDPYVKIRVLNSGFLSYPLSSEQAILLPFIVGANGEKYGRVQCSSTVFAPVLFNATQNSVQAAFFAKNVSFKIYVTNRNVTAGTYGEYYIQSDYVGTNAIVTVIKQGTASVYPYVFVDTDGVVKIKTPDSTDISTIEYKLERIDANLFPYA